MNSDRFAAPLWLLLRVNLTQSWRRLLALGQQSRLMVSVIALFVSGYVVLAFFLFRSGLEFVAGFPGLGVMLTERLLYLLFAFLFGLLLLSSLIICYSNFFRNRETLYLLTLPVPHQTVFQWKFIESALLASWAFVFLTAPLLLAFGMVRGVSWHFYLVTVVLTAMLIVLPGVAGAWGALHLARYLDRRSFQVILILGALGLLWVVAFVWHSPVASDEMLESRMLVVLDQLLGRTRFALFPFLPSYQLTSAILHWAEGLFRPAGFYMLSLLSTTLFFGTLALTRFGRLFAESTSMAQGRPGLWGTWTWMTPWRRKTSSPLFAGWLERAIERVPGLSPGTAALLHKDIVLFWRDTTQWGQTVVLFGLLGAYILNLRHFTHQLTSPFWINLIAYLNLGTCSLTLATLTTRFVFPQFSLEGQRLWIIGLAPMGLERVVRIKYWLASVTSLAVTLALVTISCALLKMERDRIVFFGVVITLMTLSLNGLATGLGVLYPNFKDPNASRIVSGFGGTLCLVLSFVYILVSVLLLAVASGGFHSNSFVALSAVLAFGAASVLTGLLPLRMGRTRLSRLEMVGG
jgi:ABC-2 type transport system permease protein